MGGMGSMDRQLSWALIMLGVALMISAAAFGRVML